MRSQLSCDGQKTLFISINMASQQRNDVTCSGHNLPSARPTVDMFNVSRQRSIGIKMSASLLLVLVLRARIGRPFVAMLPRNSARSSFVATLARISRRNCRTTQVIGFGHRGRAFSTSCRIASERDGCGSWAARHSSNLAVNSGGERKLSKGSLPVAGRPLFLGKT